MSLKDRADELRKRKDLAPIVSNILIDNAKAERVLVALQGQVADLQRQVAEQVGVCGYTAMKAIELQKKADAGILLGELLIDTASDLKAVIEERPHKAEKAAELEKSPPPTAAQQLDPTTGNPLPA